MVYLDTSAAVALFVPEPTSDAVDWRWPSRSEPAGSPPQMPTWIRTRAALAWQPADFRRLANHTPDLEGHHRVTTLASGSHPVRSPWSGPLPIWLALLWGLGALAFWPALGGPWLYDDGQLQGPIAAIHEQGLQALSGNGWRAQLIMSGNVPGRPLAMASFALNALAGTDPFGFKLVNLLLHLATGTLVFLLVRVLAAGTTAGRRSDAFALLVALVWVLHPLQVSTVAYVVQRMTILSALASVAALWLYARVRVRERSGGARARLRELVWPLLVLPPLAFLGKENGALLPLLLLTMELVLFRFAGTAPTRRRLLAYFAAAGLALVALAALMLPPERVLAAYAGRDFTLGERLLTQARMLTLYTCVAAYPNSCRWA